MAAVFYATLSATQEDYGTASAAGLILTLGFVSASCLLGVVDLVVRTWPLVGELDAEAYLVALVLVADHEAVDGALRVSPTRRRRQEDATTGRATVLTAAARRWNGVTGPKLRRSGGPAPAADDRRRGPHRRVAGCRA